MGEAKTECQIAGSTPDTSPQLMSLRLEETLVHAEQTILPGDTIENDNQGKYMMQHAWTLFCY